MSTDERGYEHRALGPYMIADEQPGGRWYIHMKRGDVRLFTYVDPSKVRSANPGYCFLCAGWKRCGSSKSGKLIFEASSGAGL